MGAFVDMPGDVSSICFFIARNPARIQVLCFHSDAKHTKGMYRQHIQKAWGHTTHRLLLDRARNVITHRPAHRGADGAAMPTDEYDQDGHFFLNHPERDGYFRLGAPASVTAV